MFNAIEFGKELMIRGNDAHFYSILKRKVFSLLNALQCEYGDRLKEKIEMPDNWNWNLDACHLFGGIEVQGKLTERIEKYLKSRYNVSLDSKDRSVLNKITDDGENQVFKVKFVDSFEWEPGDFIDYDCYYWDKTILEIESILLSNDATPIIIYNENGEGIARAITMNKEDHMIVFHSCGINLEELTKMLAAYFNCEYKIMQVKGTNNIEKYIQDEKVGVLSKLMPNVVNGYTYKLEMNMENILRCKNCKMYCYIDTCKFLNHKKEECYCEWCHFILHAYTCDGCHKEYFEKHDEYTYINAIKGGFMLCPNCLKKYEIVECNKCGSHYLESEAEKWFVEKDRGKHCIKCKKAT